MMGMYRYIVGTVQIEWVGSDIAAAFKEIGTADITIYWMESLDEVTVRFCAQRKYLRKLKEIAVKRGDRITVTSRQGLFWLLSRSKKRPVLLTGIALLLLMESILPGRILFVSVEGNQTVPSMFITETARDHGLYFGSSRREVRSERIKNGLLEEIDQLQWAGVNTYGCYAVITVRERPEPQKEVGGKSVSHMIAARDGVIQSCTVTQGSCACSVGQVVRTGDMLISGYTDCGITITAQRAAGEIFAQTKREIITVMPANQQFQTVKGKAKTKYSILIGKKRINFYKGSGISGASCDKMYWKYVLTLPGGFSLPVALVKETVAECMLVDSEIENWPQLLEDYSEAYLKSQMIAGQIIQKSESVEETGGTYWLNGTYDCIESIGIVQEEMIGEYNGESNGADRQR